MKHNQADELREMNGGFWFHLTLNSLFNRLSQTPTTCLDDVSVFCFLFASLYGESAFEDPSKQAANQI